MKTKFSKITERLRQEAAMGPVGPKDALSAADAIDELVLELVSARATFALMQIDADDMNRIGAGVTQAKIDHFLELETDE